MKERIFGCLLYKIICVRQRLALLSGMRQRLNTNEHGRLGAWILEEYQAGLLGRRNKLSIRQCSLCLIEIIPGYSSRCLDKPSLNIVPLVRG